jgi:hypothetical protein
MKRSVDRIMTTHVGSCIDVVNDGEFGKAMRRAIDFGAWWSYVYDRLVGFELRQEQAKKGRAPRSIRESLESQPLTGLV